MLCFAFQLPVRTINLGSSKSTPSKITMAKGAAVSTSSATSVMATIVTSTSTQKVKSNASSKNEANDTDSSEAPAKKKDSPEGQVKNLVAGLLWLMLA